MKFLFSVLLVSLFLLSCSSSTNSKESQGENLINQNTNIEAQISSLDAQLMHVNGMIDAARARKSMTQADSANSNNAMIDTEIAGYESQKANIISQKDALQTQIKR